MRKTEKKGVKSKVENNMKFNEFRVNLRLDLTNLNFFGRQKRFLRTIQVSESASERIGCLPHETNLFYQELVVEIVLLHLGDHFGQKSLVELHPLLSCASLRLQLRSFLTSRSPLCRRSQKVRVCGSGLQGILTRSRQKAKEVFRFFGLQFPFPIVAFSSAPVARLPYLSPHTSTFIKGIARQMDKRLLLTLFALVFVAQIGFVLCAPRVKDYYELLGIQQDATAKEIKKSYFKVAIKVWNSEKRENDASFENAQFLTFTDLESLSQYHPDKNPDVEDRSRLETHFGKLSHGA